MSTAKENIEFITRLYDLIIEANINRPDEEVLPEANNDNDAYLTNSLVLIRQLNTKAKAHLNKNYFASAQKMLDDLLSNAGNNLDSFLKGIVAGPENEKILAFFRNYTSLSEADKKSMLIDNKILEIISNAKKKIDSPQDHD